MPISSTSFHKRCSVCGHTKHVKQMSKPPRLNTGGYVAICLSCNELPKTKEVQEQKVSGMGT